MSNQSFIPYQRLELKSMSTEKLINIIRIAAENYPDTSLILTPRIDQSGQAYYWTGLVTEDARNWTSNFFLTEKSKPLSSVSY